MYLDGVQKYQCVGHLFGAKDVQAQTSVSNTYIGFQDPNSLLGQWYRFALIEL